LDAIDKDGGLGSTTRTITVGQVTQPDLRTVAPQSGSIFGETTFADANCADGIFGGEAYREDLVLN
jgi:hypothetical protein